MAKRNKSSNGQEGEDEDRLSSLSNDILINILSHLPTKSAIATTTLSHRWLGLWTQIDSLEFNTGHFKHDSLMHTTINQVLTQITSPCIRKFTLHLTFHLCSGPESRYYYPWLHQLCTTRNIEQIQVISQIHRISELPSYVFQTPSLMLLELDPLFTCELPTCDDGIDRIIHLPNLNKLRICLHQCSCASFSKLIRSCPSLEDLSFSIAFNETYPPINKHDCLDISSQSLKKLDMDLFWWSHEDAKTVINAPKLIKLKVCYRIRLLEPLLASLISCPVLEVLILRLYNENETIFTSPSSPSAYVSTHLKRIEINIDDRRTSYDNLLRVVEYLLSISQVMEKLIINIIHCFKDQYDVVYSIDEKKLCEQLYKLPISLLLRCQIVFSGIYFEARVPNGSIVMLSYWKERGS